MKNLNALALKKGTSYSSLSLLLNGKVVVM